MYNRYSINNYYLLNSFIHKLNPTSKIFLGLLSLLFVLFMNSYLDIFLVSFFLLVAVLYTDIKIIIYLKNIMIFKYFYLLIFLILLILPIKFFTIFLILYKVILIILILTIITLTTPITEIIYGIERIFRFLNKKYDINKFALRTTCLLRFIPLINEEYDRIKKVNKLHKKKNKLIFLSAFKLAKAKEEKLICNMNIRLYNYKISRTNYQMNNIHKSDILIYILCIAIFIVILLY